MLGKYRPLLREVEHTLGLGQLEEAHRLLQSGKLWRHRRARELAARLRAAFLERAQQHLGAGRWEEAIADLRYAEEIGPRDTDLCGQKQGIKELLRRQLGKWLADGMPEVAVSVGDMLRRLGLSDPEMEPLLAAAHAWLQGRRAWERGQLSLAIARYRTARQRLPECQKLTAEAAQVLEQWSDLQDHERHLWSAWCQKDWPRVLWQAQEILARVPDHPEARLACQQAWKCQSLLPDNGRDRRALYSPSRGWQGLHSRLWSRPMLSPAPNGFLLLVDGSGNYLLLLDEHISVGNQAGSASLRLLAPIGSLHAVMVRDREGYVLAACGEVRVDGSLLQGRTTLHDGDRIELARGVVFTFRLPVSFSNTAILVPQDKSYFGRSIDAVVLMAELCVVGPRPDSHIPFGAGEDRWLLSRSQGRFCLRGPGPIYLDQMPAAEEVYFWPPCCVQLPPGNLYVEPLTTGGRPRAATF
jgi:tetratricopeptide (TPR) repeat protein